MLIPDAAAAVLAAGAATAAVTGPLLLHARRRMRAAEQSAATVAQCSSGLDQQFVTQVLPWAIGQLRSGHTSAEILAGVDEHGLDPLVGGGHTAVLRAVLDALSGELRPGGTAQIEAACLQLVDEALPAAVDRLYQGEAVEDILTSIHLPHGGSELVARAHAAVVHRVLEAVDLGEGRLESTRRAFVNLARRMQGDLNEVLGALREAERDPELSKTLFAWLLDWDHRVAQVARQATNLAVVGGELPGRQWRNPYSMYQVLREAESQVQGYQRVEHGAIAEVWVAGPAVEPIACLLAELVDNATRYSPPHAPVRVTVERVPNGAVVEIHDSGRGMDAHKRAYAEAVLSGQATPSVEELGERPRFGLVVAGQLARRLGARVQLAPSVRGGVLASVFVPNEHLASAPEPPAAAGPSAPRQAEAPAPPSTSADELVAGTTAIGLPKRRHVHRGADAPRTATRSAQPTPDSADRRKAVMGALQHHRHIRATPTASPET